MNVPEFKTFRKWTLYVGGLLGAAYEIGIEHGDRPAVLVLVAGMLGLDSFLNKDEKGKEAVVQHPHVDVIVPADQIVQPQPTNKPPEPSHQPLEGGTV